MKISVIVPVYNAREYLERCVRSIFAQTYRDFEVVFVDDGSTDGSGEMLDAVAGAGAPGGARSLTFVRDDTENVRDDIENVRDDTGGVRDDIGGVRDDTGGVREDTENVRDDIENVREDTGDVLEDTAGAPGGAGSLTFVRDDTGGVRDDIGGVREDTGDVQEDTEGNRDDTENVREDITIRVVHQENGGLVKAWRAGVKESTGDYLMFVDADDWISERMLESLVRPLEESLKKQVIVCNHVIDRADGSVPKEMRHGAAPGVYEGDALTETIKKNILGNEVRTIGMSRCMKLIDKRLITDNIGWSDVNLRMGEDVAIMLPTLLDAERIVVLPGHYEYHYYYNPESMVHRYDATMGKSIHRLSAIIRAVLENKFKALGITDVDANAMAQREYQYLFTLLIKNELRRSVGAEEHAVSLCRERRMSERMTKYPAEVKDPVNVALFFFMKHPSVPYAKALRAMMQRKR